MIPDRNGVPLAVGDVVTIRAVVTHVSDGAEDLPCNLSVRLEVPRDARDARWLTLASRQVEKV